MLKFIFINVFIILSFFNLYAADATIVDACGRAIFAPNKPKRIVAIGPGAGALTVYAEMSKKLVAREVYGKTNKTPHFCPCAYPKNYGKMPIVYRNMPDSLPDYKAIIGVKPDLIIASGFNEKQINTIYQNTRVPIAAVTCGESSYMHFDSITQSLRLTGYVLKKEKNMQDIMNYMMKIRKELYDRTADVPAKKVFVVSETYDQTGSAFTSERCYAYLKMLNLHNIAATTNRSLIYYSVSKVQLMNLQPEYIFIEFPLLKNFEKDYRKNMAFYNKIDAVKKGHVYTILPYNRFSASLENVLMNSYYIGKLLYPEKFQDINMKDISDEITEEFTGNDIYDKFMKKNPVFRNLQFTSKGIVIK